jgi:hypothetical protein
LIKNLALSVASVVLTLVLLEAGLRLLGWSFPVFGRPDAELGWSFRPGVSGWLSRENTAYLRFNRFGFRGPDWPQQPPPGSFRVAVLGDSFVDSSNLPDKKALTRVIEKHLAACAALARRHVEVLNFGVSGYGTDQELLLLQQRLWAFEPNAVLLAFYAGNDVPNNCRALSVESQKMKPFFIELPSGELRLDMSFRDADEFRRALASDWQKRLVNASVLLQAVKQFRLGNSAVPRPIELRDERAAGQASEDLHAPEYRELFAPPAGDAWRSAWSVTEKLLLRMRDEARLHHVQFGLAVVPAPIEVLPGADMRMAAAQKFGLADLDYPVARIVQFAARNDVPHISLLEPLRSYGDQTRVFLYGFPPQLGHGHLNASGTRVAGRLLADWMCRRAASAAR